jgi:hypothetical protein
MENMENGIVIDGLDDVEIENTSIDEIDSENINLMFLGVDQSSSMFSFGSDMKQSLASFKDALGNSKEADEILIARADFDSSINIGGYKKISEFDTNYMTNGCTALYDVIVEGTEKLKDYRNFLKNEGMRVKAVFAIFSDGDDTASRKSFSDAKKAIEYLNHEEITTAFISFGGEAEQTAKDLGFKNIKDFSSSASELRRAFDCLSKSVIESSKSVVADADDFFQV